MVISEGQPARGRLRCLPDLAECVDVLLSGRLFHDPSMVAGCLEPDHLPLSLVLQWDIADKDVRTRTSILLSTVTRVLVSPSRPCPSGCYLEMVCKIQVDILGATDKAIMVTDDAMSALHDWGSPKNGPHGGIQRAALLRMLDRTVPEVRL